MDKFIRYSAVMVLVAINYMAFNVIGQRTEIALFGYLVVAFSFNMFLTLGILYVRDRR